MAYGMTVKEYSGTENPYLKKFKIPTENQNPYNQSITAYSPNATAAQTDAIRPMSVGGNTALGNSGNTIAASPLLKPMDNPIFQPIISGNNRQGSEYNRLAEINRSTDITNAETRQRINAYNTNVNRQNQAQQYQPGDSFTGGGEGSGLNPEQLQNARMIADIGRSRGLDERAIQIATMTALTESGLKNLNYGDRDSLGLFQQRPSQGWGSAQQVTNPTYAINKFYDSLSKTNYKGMTPWGAAQSVQRSFDPSGSNYAKQWNAAQQAYNSLYSIKPQGSTAPQGIRFAQNFINQYNNKYIDYDGKYGNQCVDLYNYYTRAIGGINIMVGYAPEIFNNYDTKAYKRIGANERGQTGMVAVFRPGGSTPSGHVAIVVGDNGNGTLRVLHSNATSAGSAGNTVISNISKASLMGYLVPNRLMGL